MPDYGQLIRTEDRAILQYRRRYGHSPNKVWRALTEPGELAAWFPPTIEGERAAGATLKFGFEQLEIDPMEGEMLEYEPPRLLEFTWGGDRLRFELERDGDDTVMTMTVTLEELGKAPLPSLLTAERELPAADVDEPVRLISRLDGRRASPGCGHDDREG